MGATTTLARWIPGDRGQRSWFLCLLAVAALLRCWDLGRMPYMHDELSALVRVLPGLDETIRVGVMEQDTHPPGVQVFEWWWTTFFGFSEAVVRLPFAVAGLLALWLWYRFAYARFGGNVALIGTALLAVLQYTVLYGQIARPYAMGMFTIALLAERGMAWVEQGRTRDLFLATLAAIASGYVHHFALLTAGLIVLTLIIWTPSERRLPVLIAGAIGAAAYAPNLPILFHQLGQGGLQGWLQPPTANWPVEFAWWLAHTHWSMALWWLLLLASALIYALQARRPNARTWAMAIIWGVMPMAIGYGYSVWRAPVLQYALVIFGFPALVFAALAGLRHAPGRVLPWLVGGTLLVGVGTLLGVRQHHTAMRASGYASLLQGALTAQANGAVAFVHLPDRFFRLYDRWWGKEHLATRLVNIDGLTDAELARLFANASAEEAYLGASIAIPEAQLARYHHQWPFLVERHDATDGQRFLARNTPYASVQDQRFISSVAPHAIGDSLWQVAPDLRLLRDTTTSYPATAWDFSGQDFGILFEAPLEQVVTADHDQLELFSTASSNGLRLVLEIEQGDSTLYYRTADALEGYTVVAGTIGPELRVPGAVLRGYVWNTAGDAPAMVGALTLRTRMGNPWTYGLFKPFSGARVFP